MVDRDYIQQLVLNDKDCQYLLNILRPYCKELDKYTNDIQKFIDLYALDELDTHEGEYDEDELAAIYLHAITKILFTKAVWVNFIKALQHRLITARPVGSTPLNYEVMGVEERPDLHLCMELQDIFNGNIVHITIIPVEDVDTYITDIEVGRTSLKNSAAVLASYFNDAITYPSNVFTIDKISPDDVEYVLNKV